MPRRAPPTLKRNHYSKYLEKRVIYQAYTLDKSTTQIAVGLDMLVQTDQAADCARTP
ncbi:hypothetical protein R3P38DRAFT_2948414 [Favolaschia claudopus]|uniref:Uncharacterized protein n=1 Tax=Favolaschia claudopus TaxID=2862362 RepID=A0AAW0BJU1_9AGAR